MRETPCGKKTHLLRALGSRHRRLAKLALPDLRCALDLGSFVTGNAGTTTNVAVYALVNAAQQAKATTLVYEATNETADYLPFQITETAGTVDGVQAIGVALILVSVTVTPLSATLPPLLTTKL